MGLGHHDFVEQSGVSIWQFYVLCDVVLIPLDIA